MSLANYRGIRLIKTKTLQSDIKLLCEEHVEKSVLNNVLLSAAMDTVIRELLPQQQPRTIERRDLQYITISKEELSTSDSLSPDPWKRDAREKAEKQQQLHIVDLLDKEIQELQVKPCRWFET